MNLFGVLDISGSALLAERQRAEVVTSNLANAESAGANPAQVYRRQEVVFDALKMLADNVQIRARQQGVNIGDPARHRVFHREQRQPRLVPTHRRDRVLETGAR